MNEKAKTSIGILLSLIAIIVSFTVPEVRNLFGLNEDKKDIINENTGGQPKLKRAAKIETRTDSEVENINNVDIKGLFDKAHSEKNYNKKVSLFTKVISLDNQFARAYNGRGDAYFVLGKLDRAKKDFDKAIEIDDQYYPALGNRAAYHVRKFNYKAALKDLNTAISINSKYDMGFVTRATVYYKLDEFQKCINDCNTILEFNSKNSQAHALRGMSKYFVGQKQEGIKDLRQSLKIDPDNYFAKDCISFINK